VRLTQEDIRGLVPHAGRMCLVEEVLEWDDARIVCRSDTHRAPDHPLSEQGKLSAIHAVEYGAQAMAIHAALLARQQGIAPKLGGYIAAIRGLQLHRRYVHDLGAMLTIQATRLGGEGGNFIYAIQVDAGDEPVLEARVTVMAQPEGRT